MRRVYRYPREVLEFIEEHAPKHSIREMAEIVNANFDTEFTESSLKAFYGNHRIHSMPRKDRKKPWMRITTPEMDAFIRENLPGTGHQAMADLVNAGFGTSFTKEQIKGYYARNKLNSGLTGRFEKGHMPATKGVPRSEYMSPEGEAKARLTQFKPGHIPHNGGVPVGEIRLRRGYTKRKGSKPYYFEKVAEPNVWRLKHQLVWEEHNGPIPDGCIVTFANGDTTNYDIDNLVLTTKAQHCVRNRLGLKSSDKESAIAANNIAELRMAIAKGKKKVKKNKEKYL